MRLYTLPILSTAAHTGMTYPERRESASFGSTEIIKRVATPDPALVARLLAKPTQPRALLVSAPLSSILSHKGRGGKIKLSDSMRRLESPELDTSVELEMSMSPAVLKILRPTESNSIQDYLKGLGRPAPHFLLNWLSAYNDWRHDIGEPKINLSDLFFSALPDDLMQKLLDFGSGRDAETFKRDRRIPGIRTNTTVQLRFNAPTKLFGHDYEAGEHTVDLKDTLQSHVEFADPKTASRVSEIELHVRHHASAGTVFRDSWTLLDGLGIPRVGLHVHIPAILPEQKLYAQTQLQAARMVEFYGRINLIAEMIHIVMHRYPIWNGKHFGPALGKKLAHLTQKLLGHNSYASYNREFYRGTYYKIAFVGFRGLGTYTHDDLYGFEYRSIIPSDDPNVIAAVLDAIQWSLHKDNYGILPEQIQNWRKVQGFTREFSSRVAETYYNHDWETVFANAPIEIQPRLSFGNRLLLKFISYRNIEIKMLLHNWSNHPLFFEDRQKQGRILIAQRYALEKVLAMQGLQTAVREFLIDSGLYEWIPGSLGLKLPTTLL